MKRELSLLLAGAMVLLCGCNSSQPAGSEPQSDPETEPTAVYETVYLLHKEKWLRGSADNRSWTEKVYEYDDSGELIATATNSYYEKDGQILEDEDWTNENCVYTYEENTQIVTSTSDSGVYVRTTVYDDEGRILSSVVVSEEEELSRTENTYDENGKIIERFDKSLSGTTVTVYRYDEQGKLLSEERTSVYSSSMTEVVRLDEYEYEDGMVVKQTGTVDGEVFDVYEFTYQDGKKSVEKIFDGEGNLEFTREYVYDGERLISWSSTDSQGNVQLTSYEYDEFGNMVRDVCKYKGEILREIVYEYIAVEIPLGR